MKPLTLLMVLALLPFTIEAKKKPKPPTQPDFEQGCIAVRDIHSTRFGLLTSAAVTGVVENNCDQTADVFVTVDFYDKAGLQFGYDIKTFTIAPHTSAEYIDGPPGYDDAALHRYGFGKIVKVDAYAAR